MEAIPSEFLGYKVLDIIGFGSFSTVAKVSCVKTNQTFAAKFINRDFLKDPNVMCRIEAELRVMERIKHPSIVSLEKIVYVKDYVVIIMEYLGGGMMYDHVAQCSGLCETEIMMHLKGIVEGLAFLHSRGIAHRDLKLDNIVLSKALMPVLIDFGMSCLKDTYFAKSLRNTLCGTLEYIAPEILSGVPYDPFASDIWALGVCTYLMYSAKFPWEGSDAAVRNKIINCDFTFPDKMPTKISSLISKMLVRDPSMRAKTDELLSIIGDPLCAARRKRDSKNLIVKPMKRFASLDNGLVIRKHYQTNGVVIKKVNSKLIV